MKFEIVNMRTTREFDIRMDRGGPFGNDASHLPYGKAKVRVRTRDEACNWFENWLNNTKEGQDTMRKFVDIVEHKRRMGKTTLRLACWCAPARCHCTSYIKRYTELFGE